MVTVSVPATEERQVTEATAKKAESAPGVATVVAPMSTPMLLLIFEPASTSPPMTPLVVMFGMNPQMASQLVPFDSNEHHSLGAMTRFVCPLMNEAVEVTVMGPGLG